MFPRYSFFLIEVFEIAFSLAPHLGPVCFERPYRGQIAPDNMAPRTSWAVSTLHHDKGAIHEGVLFIYAHSETCIWLQEYCRSTHKLNTQNNDVISNIALF